MKFSTVGNKIKSVAPLSDPRRNPVRDCRKKLDFHCQLCSKRDNDQMVQCDGCKQWFHYECVEVTDDVANVTWICPICNTAKDSTPSAIHPPTITNTNQSHRNTPNEQRTDTNRPKSKAGSVRSKTSSAKIRELEVQRLQEEFKLETKYLELRYRVLMDNVSDKGSVISELDKMSKIQEWVDETERHGEQNDSGLAEEVNALASDYLKQPRESQTPRHTQHNESPSIRSSRTNQVGQGSVHLHINQNPPKINNPTSL